MSQVITFFFSTLGTIWNVITSYWILSFSVILSIFSLIISLIRTSSNKSDK